MILVALGAYAFVTVFRWGLTLLNLSYLRLHGAEVPAIFRDTVDAEKLRESAAYARAQARLGLVRSFVSNGFVLAFLFLGGLGWYDAWLARTTTSFVGGGILFFLGLSWAGLLFEIPFGWYSTFRLETRYGFNRTTVGLWWSDWLKGVALSSLLITILASGGLALIQAFPDTWWFWVWAAYAAFSVFLMLIAPYVIEPLFFKMTPLKGDGLEAEVQALAERTGVRVKQVLEMDASRRSSHSNAYFTGLGRVKRVVLFDTLRERLTTPEIISILAHELGHWKLKHVTKRLFSSLGLALLGIYLGFQLLAWPDLPKFVGLETASFQARVVIVALLAEIATFPLTPLFSRWSRTHEWQADHFASELTGRPHDLGHALTKLARDNLANLHPHPFYAAFYYSHPPMVERVQKLFSPVAS